MYIVDITGPIHNGMWNYGDPFPEFSLTPIESPEWVPYEVVGDIFTGLHSQTGTYFETPGHFPAAGINYTVDQIPFSDLIDLSTHVIRLQRPMETSVRDPITAKDIRQALDHYGTISPGETILIDTGWGKYWRDSFFLECPYFTYDGFQLLLDLKPRILGTDFPRWENSEQMQHIFPDFYAQDIWMLNPLINLDKIESKGLLSVLPLNVENSCCVPCRAFVKCD